MLTGLTELAEDVTAVLKDVEPREGGRACVLVGHSSGGELVQYILGKSMYTAAGMALIAAIPNFGMTGVYWNWCKLDPWVMLRSMVH